MRSSRLLIAPFLLLFIGGCSATIPEPISYPYSQQQKMQAAHHWEVLAADLANRINNELITTDNIDKAVFVKQTCGNDAESCVPGETGSFSEAFRDLLITYLVDFGITTRNEKTADTLEINYKVQVVRHNADRRRSLQPGLLTTLSAAVVVLRHAPADLVYLAIGTTADVANSSLVTNGKYEVLITTSIVEKARYLFRSTDIYYINDKDFWQYQDRMPEMKTIKLTAGKKPEPVHDPPARPEANVVEPPPLQLPPEEHKDV